MKYGNRLNKKKFTVSPLLLIAVVVFFGLLTKATWNMYKKSVFSEERLKTANEELAKLKSHESDLRSHVDYLSTDEGIEAEFRTKYRAVREGESVAVIIDQKNEAAASQAEVVKEEEGWWGNLLKKIGF